MKSKKLLIALAIVAVLIVIVVVLASVLTVKEVRLIYHDFSGVTVQGPEGSVVPNDVLSFAKGKSIVFLNKTNLMDDLNQNEAFSGWHFFAVVKEAPSTIVVHLVKREAIAKIQGSEGFVYVNSFGYRTEEPQDDIHKNVIDITTAFSGSTMSFTTNKVGEKLVFADSKNNERLDYVLNALLTAWQCYIDVEDMSAVLGMENVFHFDGDDMLIKPQMGGTIRVKSPGVDLSDRLIKGFSVYYSDQINLHSDEFTVVVPEKGNITTNKSELK